MADTPARSPKVSIIIPCYNLGRYLDEAVSSVLAQSFQDFEILIVDDGSTDAETRRLLEGYQRPRTRVVSTNNSGLPGAKNAGLSGTTGGYVCMLDADDRLGSGYLEKSVAALDEDPTLAFVSHWLRTFGDEEADWAPISCDFPALLDVNTVNGAALVRRGALEAAGGFDPAFKDGCEDWDIWISLVSRGFRGRILPEVLFYYRRRAGSMSRAMAGLHPEFYRRLVLKHADTYRRYLPSLLVRRERDISTLRREIHRMELDLHERLEPDLQSLRDDSVSSQKRARHEAQQAEMEEIARTAQARQVEMETIVREAEARADLREEELRGLRRAEQTLRVQLGALTQDVTRLAGDAEALRTSWSWRMTAPLRHIYERLRSIRGRTS